MTFGQTANQRLELAGLPGRGSVDGLVIREPAVEPFISLQPARRPQLKRGRSTATSIFLGKEHLRCAGFAPALASFA